MRTSKLSAVAAAIFLAACSGSTGPTGDAGPAGPPGSTGPTGPTGPTCQIVPMATRLYANITKVSIPNAATTGGIPTITYRLFNDSALTQATTCIGGGSTGYAPFTPNFTIAKLITDPENPNTQMWQSYINKSFENAASVASAEGGHNSYPGVLVDNGDGSCSYTYQADLSKVVTPTSTAAVTEAYEPNANTRFGMQNNPTDPDATHPAFDGTVTVLASSGGIVSSDPRELVTQAACNACHFQVAHHGAKRLSVSFCVSCHNQGTPDPDPTSVNSVSLDMAVMIHKIHQGSQLPSVTSVDLNGVALPPSSTTGTIIINGTDYTSVIFPQSTGNCAVCHSVPPPTTGNDYWKTQASVEACGACHDRTWFTSVTPPTGWVLHTGSVQADGSCVNCHGAGLAANAAAVHTVTPPAPKSVLTINSVAGAAGQALNVAFSVTDPQSGLPQDLATDALWTTSGARLVFDFGYTVQPGEDWTNTGSGATTGFGSTVPGGSPAPGQPLSFDVLAGLKATPATVTKNADGGYAFTTAFDLPASAVGSGVAVLEGHPETGTTELPVRTDSLFFAITDTTAQPRRSVVDIQKCDVCHGVLSLHGSNRTDNINACVTCHNTEATDVTQRPQPASTLGIDGKTEQAIDFATMIHGIHDAQIVVYSFTGTPPGVGPPSPTDYRNLLFPEGNSVHHCDICHNDANPFPAADTIGIVNGVTQITLDSANQATYLRTTTTMAVCSSCHTESDALDHMLLNGGAPSLTQAAINSAVPGAAGVEACTVCHSSGSAFDPAIFHNVLP
jgi:OmcA/MtrC family decaheme c-type cytochrome